MIISVSTRQLNFLRPEVLEGLVSFCLVPYLCKELDWKLSGVCCFLVQIKAIVLLSSAKKEMNSASCSQISPSCNSIDIVFN